jgi:opacity protein-like surface antigen
MKKLGLAMAFLLVGSLAAMAQAPSQPWTYQLSAGYNTNTGWMKSGWNASTGIGYSFNDSFKLNFDVGYFEGKVKDIDIKDHIWTFMVAPEYVYKISDSDQVYALIGAGVARRDSKDYTFYSTLPPTPVHLASESKFAAEAGVGYRHYFNKSVGLQLQATYTHMAFKDKSLNPVDGRVGLVVRF